jgi:electron transport complex protein RnfC
MLERPDDIMDGILPIIRAFGLEKAYIGVEDNKPLAIETLKKAAAKKGGKIEIFPLKTKYPQGGEKQLIKSITGREVPSGGLPAAVGAAVFNWELRGGARRIY